MIDGLPTGVVQALKNGDLPKNYRINVLNDDGTVDFTIDNNTLVSESVKLDERMCSGDILKFGLCEGSSLEFQYFDHPSILGKRLQVFVDAYYDNYVEQVISIDYEDMGRISRWGNITVFEGGEYRLYSPLANAFSSVIVSNNSGSNTFTPSETSPATICDVTVDLGSSGYAQIVVNWPEDDYPEVHLQKIIKH